jgi:predicted Co/Zn/Cd cation transporter (cation efflux family)
MIFVDHVIGWFLEGAEGDFLEVGVDPFMLSLCMVIPVFMVWEIAVILDRVKITKTENKNKNATEEAQ